MEDKNLTENEAKQEADELFLPRERRLLIKDYKTFLTRAYAIKRSPLHNQITKETQNLMEENGYSFGKALSLVLRRNRHMFDELLEDDNSDEESEYSDVDEDSDDENTN